jgi:predicted  nucleic acid-binding Zn-ribbon protein
MSVKTSHWMILAMLIGCSKAGIAPFSELDRDGDGRISADEARVDPALDRAFSDADADADGRLTANEYLTAVRRI